jgi:hypothetical protein
MTDPSQRQSAIMGFPSRTHRWSAASGIAAVILGVASTLLFGFDIPTYDDAPRDFAQFYAANSDDIQLSVLLGALALASLAWFLGFLRWIFGTDEMATRGFVRVSSIAMVGGIAGIAAAAVNGMAAQTAVVAQGTVDPGVVRALDLFGDYALVHSGLFFSVFLLAAFFLIRVTNVLPQWLGWTAVAGFVLGLLQTILLLAPQDDDGPLGALGVIWFALFLLWVLGASIALVRRV